MSKKTEEQTTNVTDESPSLLKKVVDVSDAFGSVLDPLVKVADKINDLANDKCKRSVEQVDRNISIDKHNMARENHSEDFSMKKINNMRDKRALRREEELSFIEHLHNLEEAKRKAMEAGIDVEEEFMRFRHQLLAEDTAYQELLHREIELSNQRQKNLETLLQLEYIRRSNIESLNQLCNKFFSTPIKLNELPKGKLEFDGKIYREASDNLTVDNNHQDDILFKLKYIGNDIEIGHGVDLVWEVQNHNKYVDPSLGILPTLIIDGVILRLREDAVVTTEEVEYLRQELAKRRLRDTLLMEEETQLTNILEQVKSNFTYILSKKPIKEIISDGFNTSMNIGKETLDRGYAAIEGVTNFIQDNIPKLKGK